MRQRALALATLLAAAAACAPVPKGDADAPLAARLGVTATGLDVGLSDRAHVAVFSVAPGYGVSLVYPQLHERSRFAAGWSPVVYQGGDRGMTVGPVARFAAHRSTSVMVLIASREPLDVRDYAQGGASLERALGTAAYRAYDADAVVQGLVNLVAAGHDADDVTVDVVVVPPALPASGRLAYDDGRFPFEQPYVVVYCNTPGAPTTVVVHVEFARYACAPRDNPQTVDSTRWAEGGEGASADHVPAPRTEPAESRRFTPPVVDEPAVHRAPAEPARAGPAVRERQPPSEPAPGTAGRRPPERTQPVRGPVRGTGGERRTP